MADYYIDPSTGDDTTGSGTSSYPWATLQKGIDNANGGDTIYLANTAADVVTSQINWSFFGSTTGSNTTNPLMIRGWDNGGSITIASPVATITGVGEIDTTGQSFSPLFSTSSRPNDIIFYRIKFTGQGSTGNTSTYISCGNRWGFYECEFVADRYGAFCLGGGQDNQVVGCYLHSDGVSTTSQGITSFGVNNRTSNIAYCYFKDLTRCIQSVRGGIYSCVFDSIATNIPPLRQAQGAVFGNTIYTSGSTTTSLVEIHSAFLPVMNNIIKGANGVGGVGISTADGNTPFMLGNNHFHDNSTNMSATPRLSLGTDQTNDPTFTDAAGGDFSVGSNAQGKGYAGLPGSSTTNYLNMGAVQEQAGSGGSGSSYTPAASAKFTRLE